MPTLNVNLTERLARLVRDKVESGLYNNASEVVREGLRLLHGQEFSNTLIRPLHRDELLQKIRKYEDILKERGVHSLYLFGSVLSDCAEAGSDIDLFFDPNPDKEKFSLIDLVGIKLFLEEILGAKVDLALKEGLDPLIKETVVAEALKVF